MRKLISLGLLALTLSLISSQVLAGQFAACEAEKQDYQALGVYGLCNAWHNAKTPEAQAKFAEKFEEIWRDELGNESPLPDWLAGEGFKCPCWAGVELDESSVPMWCFTSDFTMVQFGSGPAQIFSADGAYCYYGDGSGSDMPDESGNCFTELMDIVDEYFAEGALCSSL